MATASGAEAGGEGAADGAQAPGLLAPGKGSASLLGEQGRGEGALRADSQGWGQLWERSPADREGEGRPQGGARHSLSPRLGQGGQESTARAKGKAVAAALASGRTPKVAVAVTVPESAGAGTKDGASLLSPRGKSRTPVAPKAGRPTPLNLGKPAAGPGAGKGH